MSMMQIRGAQIKDHQIKDIHIDGKLTETVLDIDFASHAAEILEEKKVVDYVQRNAQDITSGTAFFTFSSEVAPAPSAEAKGIVVDLYEVKLRLTATGDPVVLTIDGEKCSVFGDLIFVDGTDPTYNYRVNFKAKKADGSVVNATIAESAKIDILYPRRFSLQTVHETFASNERFVDAAADTTAYLNIAQLAKELFGSSYSINNNGDVSNPFGNGKTVQIQLNDETHGVVNTGVSASVTIDEVIAARGGKDSLNIRLVDIENEIAEEILSIRTDLASEAVDKGSNLIHVQNGSTIYNGLGLTSGNATLQKTLDDLYTKVVTDDTRIVTDLASLGAGKGASTVGVQDDAAVFVATTVELVLKELYDKIVTDVTAEAAIRLADDNALRTRATNLETEVTAARGTMSDVKGRLDVSLMDDGQLKEYTVFHKHIDKYATIGTNAESVEFTFSGLDQFSKPKTTDYYSFAINGVEQAQSIHYTVAVDPDSYKVTVSMVGTTLWAGDVVTLKSSIFAVPQK